MINLIYFLPALLLNPVGRYQAEKQVCSAITSTLVQWSFSINKDSTYSYLIAKKSNQYLSKPIYIRSGGSWSYFSDTLYLYNWNKTNVEMMFCVKDSGQYLEYIPSIVKKDFLYFNGLRKQ